MFLGASTVKSHLDNLMERTGIHSRTALVAQASRLGIAVSEADRLKQEE
jgi:DNA-binding NarL/FixJ family response regulator